MMQYGVAVPFDVICQLLEYSIEWLGALQKSVAEATGSARICAQEELDENLHEVLYLLVIAAKVRLKFSASSAWITVALYF